MLNRKTIAELKKILLFFQDIGNEWNSQKTRHIVQAKADERLQFLVG